MDLSATRSPKDLDQFNHLEVLNFLEENTKWISGSKEISCKQDECIVVVTVKNGTPYLPEFMQHYQEILKVGHMVFLDNGSTDSTIELLKEYDKVSIFQNLLPYKVFYHSFYQYLVQTFGRGKWTIVADIDELFDFPYSNIIPLPEFIRYLNAHKYNIVITQMLDLFASQDIKNPEEMNGDYRKIHNYYDLSGLFKEDYFEWKFSYPIVNDLANSEIKFHKGGIRNTVFGLDAVWLSKHSMIFFQESLTYPHPHLVMNGKIADVSCVLYHYKFLNHFMEYAKDAAEKGYHADDSKEYKIYLEKLGKEKGLNMKQSTSRQLSSIGELIDSGFLVVSKQYTQWIMDACPTGLSSRQKRKFRKTLRTKPDNWINRIYTKIRLTVYYRHKWLKRKISKISGTL